MDLGAAGKTFPPYEFRVEWGKIKEFADAIGDDDPIYRDAVYAATTPAGGIAAPPTFLRTFLHEPRTSVEALQIRDWSYIVHGEQEFEYFAPIVAGDVLTAHERIVSVTEKDSRRAGKLHIAVIETVFHNRRGEKVQVARRTLVETSQRIRD
jgi:acyl dehydratase